jgi:hypothetical protein
MQVWRGGGQATCTHHRDTRMCIGTHQHQHQHRHPPTHTRHSQCARERQHGWATGGEVTVADAHLQHQDTAPHVVHHPRALVAPCGRAERHGYGAPDVTGGGEVLKTAVPLSSEFPPLPSEFPPLMKTVQRPRSNPCPVSPDAGLHALGKATRHQALQRLRGVVHAMGQACAGKKGRRI